MKLYIHTYILLRGAFVLTATEVARGHYESTAIIPEFVQVPVQSRNQHVAFRSSEIKPGPTELFWLYKK